MDAKKCDRCGKFYGEFKSAYEANKLLYTTSDYGRFVYARKMIDLCPDCTDALGMFLHGAELQYDEPETLEVYPTPHRKGGGKHE